MYNDGDGLPDLLEFALGRSPSVRDDHPIHTENGKIIARFTPEVVSGVTCRLERSSDLRTWESIASLGNLTPGQEVVIEHQITRSKDFIRLVVSQ